jgi:hypothetical protein
MTITPVTMSDYNVGFYSRMGKERDNLGRFRFTAVLVLSSFVARPDKKTRERRPTAMKWYRGRKIEFFVSGSPAVPDK